MLSVITNALVFFNIIFPPCHLNYQAVATPPTPRIKPLGCGLYVAIRLHFNRRKALDPHGCRNRYRGAILPAGKNHRIGIRRISDRSWLTLELSPCLCQMPLLAKALPKSLLNHLFMAVTNQWTGKEQDYRNKC